MARMTTARKLLLGLLGGGGAAAAFSPIDIADLALWLDASDSTTLFQASNGTTPAVADGDVVGYWGDKSGAGNVVIQTTTAFKPTLQTAEQNGLNVVQFDGSDDNLIRNTVGSALFSADSIYVAAVINQNSTQAQNTLMAWETNAITNRVLIYATYSDTFYWDTGTQDGTGRISAGQPVGWDDSFHVLECYRNGADGSISVDGAPLVTSNSLSATLDASLTANFYLAVTAASEYFKGFIGEMVIYKAAPSAAGQTAIRDYLTTKWGL
jgi:hypothetical protein